MYHTLRKASGVLFTCQEKTDTTCTKDLTRTRPVFGCITFACLLRAESMQVDHIHEYVTPHYVIMPETH